VSCIEVRACIIQLLPPFGYSVNEILCLNNDGDPEKGNGIIGICVVRSDHL
jgi:hypothetical protein